MSPGVFALAPRVLARAAAFPLERLACFPGPPWPSDQRSWQRRLDEERQALHATTAADPVFLRALCLAHPELARRALAWRPQDPPNKRTRHLMTTLYRYLGRAVGRTDPCGAWAGVALARFGASTRVLAAPGRLRLAPELAPYHHLLRTLGRRDPYLLRAHFALNPSLRPLGGGRFALSLPQEGRVEERRLRLGPAVAATLERARGLPPLPGRRLAQRLSWPLDQAADILSSWTSSGLLVGGLALPSRFEHPHQALARAARALLPPDRQAWLEVTRELRRACDALEREYAGLSPAALLARLSTLAALPAALAARLGVAPPPPSRSPLRADLVLPWRIELGPELADRWGELLERAWGRSTLGPGPELLRARRAHFKAWLGAGRSPLEPPTRTSPAEPRAPLSWRLARLDEAEAFVAPNPAATPPITLGLARMRGLGGRCLLEGVSTEPAAVLGRFLPLLEPRPGPLSAWLAGALGDLGRRAGARVVELAGPYPDSPNVLAHRPLLAERTSLWCALPGELPLAGARLIPAPPPLGALLAPERGPPCVLVALSAAELGANDPLSSLLLRAGLRDPPSPSFRVGEEPAAHEDPGLALGPRLVAPGGALLRARRATLLPAQVRELLSLKGFARYTRWCAWAEQHRWPPLVRLRAGGRPPVLLPTRSPLALECALEGARPEHTLSVEEWLADLSVESSAGAHHTLELAVPFAARAAGGASPGAARATTAGGER